MTNKSILILAVFVITAGPAHAQAQKQIPLGGGFVLNTGIPQEVNSKGLNALFPVKMDNVPSFRPLYAPAAPQNEPEVKNLVRTICGEWVDKSSAVPVYEGRDWYVQKGSACAREYFESWLGQQDLSFIQAAEKRLSCENRLPKTKEPQHVCPVCARPIDGRCGAVATVRGGNQKPVYMHADCRAKARHEAKAAALQNALGLPAASADEAAQTPKTPAAAPTPLEVKHKLTKTLGNIQIKSQTRPDARPVPPAEMNAFIAKNASALNAAARKKRAGRELSAAENALLANFETLRQGYASAAQQSAQTASVPARTVKRPAKTNVKKVQKVQKSKRTSAAQTPQGPQPYAALRRAGVPANELLKKSSVDQDPPRQAEKPVQFAAAAHRVVNKKDVRRFERLHKKELPLIRLVLKTGAASNPQIEALAGYYKDLLDGYAYSRTPEGRTAHKRLEEFERAHAREINLIKQWNAYSVEKAPEDYKPLIKEYRQILKEGNLRPW